MTTRWRWSPRRKCAPAAWPTRRAVSAVIGSRLVVPRIPSVPKNLRVIAIALARLADPAPDSRGHRMRPCRNEEQQGSAGEGDCPWIGDAASERNESRLRGPFVPRLAHQLGLFAVLAIGTNEREEDDRAIE